jgi:integrase
MPRTPARPKGHIRRRGSRYWVYVPRGRDPVTGRYRYAYDSADTVEEAERKRDELIERLAAGRELPGKLTFGVLLDRWLQAGGQAAGDRGVDQGQIEQVIRPVLGGWRVRDLEIRVDVLDRLYAYLRRCDQLCDGRRFTEHSCTGSERISRAISVAAGRRPGRLGSAVGHDCGQGGCGAHQCQPMTATAVRRIHDIIAAAYQFAITEGWADRNPAEHASPPRLSAARAEPADAAEAAALIEAAWRRDPALGTFVWLTVVTGARRGELVVLRWSDIDWAGATLLIQRRYLAYAGQPAVTDLKLRVQRCPSLDPATVGILRAHLQAQQATCARMGVAFRPDSYVFTHDGLGDEPWAPGSVTQRYGRLRDQLGLSCRLDDLRHYSASQVTAESTRALAGLCRPGDRGVGGAVPVIDSGQPDPADQRAAGLLTRSLPRHDHGTGSS